ncbi:MAG TPA: helix-turn-helix domain-containing protein [Myxococcales bacterium]|jgi:predicted DNA-binding transcriptional regulator AlpA
MEAKQLPAEENLWTVARVAKFLDLSTCWVYRAAERDELPVLRIGAALRFDPAEIRAWLKGRRPAHAQVIPFKPEG